MEIFLQHLNESISVVDIQLDFERLVSAVRSAEVTDQGHEIIMREISIFIDSHRPHPRHTDYLVETIWKVIMNASSKDHRPEILELLYRVLRGQKIGLRLLSELSHEGRDLLEMLEDRDAFVRFHVLRILKEAVSHDKGKVVATLLEAPEILAGIVEMSRVDNSSEFLRNEALSFLVEMSGKANPDLAAILAYQGLAECVFDILMESECGVSDNEVSDQAIKCLRNLCSHMQCSRYIRESGGCTMISDFLAFALGPILDHAQGIASDETEEDPVVLQKRIDAGWKQCDKMLEIADILMTDMEDGSMKQVFFTAGAVTTMATAGESLYLTPEARAACYVFIGHVIENNEEGSELLVAKRKDLPLLWSMYRQMMSERTPLVVRSAIDLVVEAACRACQKIQHLLVSFMASCDAQEELMEEAAYVDESPGRMAIAVLMHACNSVHFRIPDKSALAEQVWFAFRTFSHIFSGNVDVMRSATLLRARRETTDSLTLPHLVVKLAANRLLPSENDDDDKDEDKCVIVFCACIRLLIQWLLAVPSLASLVTADIQLLKLLHDLICSEEDDGLSAALIGLCLSIADDQEAIESVANRAGLARIYASFQKLLTESNVKQKQSASRVAKFSTYGPVSSLPTVSDGFGRIVGFFSKSLRNAVLQRFLGPVTVQGPQADCEEYLRAQARRVDELELELESARRARIDLQVLLNVAVPEDLITENEKLANLVNQLQKEVRANECEIQRISVIKETETRVWKSLTEELEQQVHALSVSNAQFVELLNTQTDSKVFFSELINEINARWPETRQLTDPVILR